MNYLSSISFSIVFITLAGLPTATLNGGISLVTTLPAPITEPFPILILGKITTFPPYPNIIFYCYGFVKA